MSFNKIIVVGNLGRDPELRYTPQGIAVCNFTLATNEKKKDKSGEMQDVATWFRIVLWRNQAENTAKFLKKGSLVYVEGRLGVEEWKDRDGNSRYTLEIQGSDVKFLNSGTQSIQGQEPDNEHDMAPQPEMPGPPTEGHSVVAPKSKKDDIPF